MHSKYLVEALGDGAPDNTFIFLLMLFWGNRQI